MILQKAVSATTADRLISEIPSRRESGNQAVIFF